MVSSKFKVVVAEKMAMEGIHLLKYNPAFDVVVLDKNDNDKLMVELKTADAVVVRSGVKITKDHLADAPNLKIVGRAGAGYDNIDVPACTKKGIVVMTAPSGNTNSVVELAIGLMIALIRHIPKADTTMKAGKWEKVKLEGTELRGKTIGLIGLGRIGSQVGQICEAMGMKIMALVQNKAKKRSFPFRGIFVEKLNDMLPNVDFLSLHAPLTEKTRQMVGADQLKLMKPGAFIINTSRGDLIDEKALFQALSENKIAGAAIDVYSEEPASKEKFPFIALENVVAMPHLGASTEEAQANVSKIICENIIDALSNGVYIDAVNLPFAIPSDEAGIYRPYLTLAKKLSQIGGQWSKKAIKGIKITYHFTQQLDIQPMVMSACTQLLHYSDSTVSLVNIKSYLDTHPIELILKQSTKLEYDDSLKIMLTYDDNTEFVVRGVITAKTIPKIVQIQGRAIEVIPTGHMIVYENKNVPGVVGAVGTLLGNEKINISDIHLSTANESQNVIACVMVDQMISDTSIAHLLEIDNILDAKWITFE